MNRLFATSSFLALVLAVPVMAQDSDTQNAQNAKDQNAGSQNDMSVDVLRGRVMALRDWDYGDLYQEGTWSAEQLFGAEVYGSEGNAIGGVENIVVGTNGSIQSLILEVGELDPFDFDRLQPNSGANSSEG